MIQGMYVNLAELLYHWSNVDMFFANAADSEDGFDICTAIYLAIWNVSLCKSHEGIWGVECISTNSQPFLYMNAG
jgi:hypothetical protein